MNFSATITSCILHQFRCLRPGFCSSSINTPDLFNSFSDFFTAFMAADSVCSISLLWPPLNQQEHVQYNFEVASMDAQQRQVWKISPHRFSQEIDPIAHSTFVSIRPISSRPHNAGSTKALHDAQNYLANPRTPPA